MPGVRVVIQCVESASLLVDNKDQWVNIDRGLIVYVSFLKGADEKALNDAVSSIVSIKLIRSPDTSESMSILECHGDILVIPQASLAGKIKNKGSIQYHSLIEKETGAKLYEHFVRLLQERIENHHTNDHSNNNHPSTNDNINLCSDQQSTKKGKVQFGTYGNRQGLKLISNGPYTHQFEF